MEDIILIGGGGHCRSVIDSIMTNNKYNIKGIIDIEENVGSIIGSHKVIGIDSDLNKLNHEGIKYAFITLGSIGLSTKRESLYNYCKEIGYIIPNIIDNSAILANDVNLGSGIYIGKGAVVNSNSNIGSNSIINSGSIIEHDCIIGKNVHISPGSVVGGQVVIGNNTHLGIGSTVIQSIKIGNDVLIGSSSNVVKDIISFSRVYGNPAKEH